MKPILVVGSINLDLVAAAPRIPAAGETILGTQFGTFPGGKGANQAFAAARLGHAVSMIGKLGEDAFGSQLRAHLESAGVRTGAIGTAAESSGVAQILTAPDGENVIVVVPGANARLEPADLDKNLELIRTAGMILTQLEIPLETVTHLAAIAGREDVPLMLDPAPAQPLSESLLRCVTWLTPNEPETCALLGLPLQELPVEKLEELADKLGQRGAGNVVLKLGSRGCYLSLADGTKALVPAFAVKAVDTTAAGDAFNAGFAVSLLSGRGATESAVWASAVAAISVTRAGAQPSMPTREEVEKFLRERVPQR